MKKTSTILVILLIVVKSVYSQETPNRKIYDYDKLVALTSATNEQKEQLKNALEIRIKKLSKTEVAEEQKLIDKQFFNQFKQIFSDHQQVAVYDAQINKKVLKEKVLTKFKNLNKKVFLPSDYFPIAKEIFFNFEYSINMIRQRIPFNKETRQQLVKKLTQKRSNWLILHKKINKKVEFSSNNTLASCGNLSTDKKNIKTYYFYINLIKSGNDTSRVVGLFTNFKNKNNFSNLVSKLIECEIVSCQNIFNYDPLKSFDDETKLKARTLLNAFVLKKINAKINNNNKLDIKPKSNSLKKMAKEIGGKITSELKVDKHDEEIAKLKANAVNAGLDDQRISKFVSLVLTHKKDLEDLKKQYKKQSKSDDIIVESPKKTKYQLSKAFNNKISKLISLKEFSKVFGFKFKKSALAKMKEQYEFVITNYEFSKVQKTQVFNVVLNYFYKESIINNYYKYNGPKRKQKLSVLRYNHEKAYKELLQSFNIEVNDIKKIDNNTFQWN